MTDESYIHTLCEQYLKDDCTPGYDNLDPEERAGVLAEIIQDDPDYGWELIGQLAPMCGKDIALPLILARLLEARSEGDWSRVGRVGAELTGYLTGHSILCSKAAIENALDAAFEQAEQDARERFEEDDGRGDYLYQVRKDDALTGDL